MHCAGLRTDHWYLLLIFDFSNTSPRFLFVTCVFWLISSFLKSSAATEKFFPLVISLWVEHVRGFVLPRSSTNKIMHETGLQEITIIIIMLTTSHKVISEQSQQLDFLSLQEFSTLRLYRKFWFMIPGLYPFLCYVGPNVPEILSLFPLYFISIVFRDLVPMLLQTDETKKFLKDINILKCFPHTICIKKRHKNKTKY